MNGLVISLTIAPGRQIFTSRGGGGEDFNLTMSDVQLHYDSCVMTPRYNQFYQQSYASGGFRVVLDTYSAHTVNSLTSGAGTQVTLSLAAKRAKGIMSVIRCQAFINSQDYSHYSATGFLSQTDTGSFQYAYESQGTRMPPSSIDSFA